MKRSQSPGENDLRLFLAALQAGLVPDEEILFRIADAFSRIVDRDEDPSRALRLKPGRGRKEPPAPEVYRRARVALLVHMERAVVNRDEAIERVAARESIPEGTVREYYTKYRRFAAALASPSEDSNLWRDFNRHNLQPREAVSVNDFAAVRKSLQAQQLLKSGRRWRPPKK